MNLKYDFELVKDAEDAQNKKFLGSPTMGINGVDLEKKETEYFFGCRIYTINSRITGLPTNDYIKEKPAFHYYEKLTTNSNIHF